MLAQERQDIIIEMLKQSGGIIKMTDIVSKFGVSNETARRDLETLQDKDLVKRIYGGRSPGQTPRKDRLHHSPHRRRKPRTGRTDSHRQKRRQI